MTYSSSQYGTRLSLSIFLWLALCVGLLFTIYYYEFETNVNIIIKNTNNSYVAAVIDFRGFYTMNYEWTTLLNLYQYVAIIRKTSQYMVDIVIFPECGLFPCGKYERDVVAYNAITVPSVEEAAIPCDNYVGYAEVISRLSCAAKESDIYVAVDVVEKYCLENCTVDNVLLYFTEVVFDRRGKIIARYRKYNLFFEQWTMGINRTEKAELVTFETDFNETFGIAICYDLLFQDPAVTLVKEKHVTSMIYSASLLNSLPFFGAPSLEAGWSYAMDVNLLASSLPVNQSFPASNIYFGRNEFLHTYVVEFRKSNIIIGTVPKNGSKYTNDVIVSTELQSYSPSGPKTKSYSVDYILNYTTVAPLFANSNKLVVYNTKMEKNDFNYNSKNFDCYVTVMWKNNNVTEKPNFKFLAYSGPGSFSISSVNNYVEMCGLVLCSKEPGKCSFPPDFSDSSRITIISLNIVATSWKNTSLTIPITLNSELVPMPPSVFSYNTFTTIIGNQELKVMEMNLKKETSDLVNFGMTTLPQKSTPLPVDKVTPQMLLLAL